MSLDVVSPYSPNSALGLYIRNEFCILFLDLRRGLGQARDVIGGDVGGGGDGVA